MNDVVVVVVTVMVFVLLYHRLGIWACAISTMRTPVACGVGDLQFVVNRNRQRHCHRFGITEDIYDVQW